VIVTDKNLTTEKYKSFSCQQISGILTSEKNKSTGRWQVIDGDLDGDKK